MASPDYSELVSAVRASANRLGVDPSDLLTAMSYETGGKLSTGLWGGAKNNYLGLIQFGPEERAKYGVTPDQSYTDQVGAAESFLRDRGVKPGMGLLDIYSTINAGRPGLYNRSDAANGGAPGTVADKVASMAGHRMRANALLGIPGDASAPQVASNPVQASTPAPQAPSVPLSISPAGAPASAGSDMGPMLAALQQMAGASQQPNTIQPVEAPPIQYFTPRRGRFTGRA